MSDGLEEDGTLVLHMCEWYEHGRRYVAEYEQLGDGSGFAVTQDWSTGVEIRENHMLTRPDGTLLPGIERFRRHDIEIGPNDGCRMDDYGAWEKELRIQREHDRFDGALRALGVLDSKESVFGSK